MPHCLYASRFSKTIFFSIKGKTTRQLLLIKENIQPIQSLAGFSWLFSGAMLSSEFGRSLLGAAAPSATSVTSLLPFSSSCIFSTLSFVVMIAAFTLARAAGMSLNRLIDAKIDAQNPRTAMRVLPSKRAHPKEIALQSGLFLLLFFGLSLLLNRNEQILAGVVAIVIVGYSFTKRVTFLCHYVLGVVHFCIPLAGSLLVIPSFFSIPYSVWLSCCAALCSVSSCDILYSLQDEIFDRKHHLYSIPACFGRQKAINIATLTYMTALICATASLMLFFPNAIATYFWSSSCLIFLTMWWMLCKKEGSVIANRFSYVLPSLPLFFLLSVYIEWIAI